MSVPKLSDNNTGAYNHRLNARRYRTYIKATKGKPRLIKPRYSPQNERYISSMIICGLPTLTSIYNQGLQEKFCKAEQDCFGASETGQDFTQN